MKIIKIIFDSEEQLNKFKDIHCPDDFGWKIGRLKLSHDPDDCASNRCEECWKKCSEIQLEVDNSGEC